MKDLVTILVIAVLVILFFVYSGFKRKEGQTNYDEARRIMVERQIKSRGVKDQKVLDAMLKVERHKFVPDKYISKAYDDNPLPIGHGQTISQPYIVAFMTEILELSKKDKVLEIGTGSGYQAAVLGELSDSVYTIEIVEPLGIKSKKLMADLGYDNVHVRIGDGYKGWPEEEPFDAIIVTCAPNNIPEPLQQQLAENGRMIIPVGDRGGQKLVLLKKIKGKLKPQNVLSVIFVPMVDETGTKY